tara:strand:+ start:1149 stop:2354 length:1206 start_codon:yes stop_codon:yes gene_type:complete
MLPLMLYLWGDVKYGLWLVLTAIPSYLAIGDFGFSLAAANAMTSAVAKGTVREANAIFNSTLFLTTASCLLLGFLVFVLLSSVSSISSFQAVAIESPEALITLGLLAVSTLLTLSWSVFGAAFRADGQYAFQLMVQNITRAAEAAAIIVSASVCDSLIWPALACVVVRLLSYLSSLYLVKRRIPWIDYRLADVQFGVYRRLWHPALAAMTFPLGFAFVVQGATILVGHLLGLAAVPAFVAIRTFARLIMQATAILSYPMIPEISIAYGQNDSAALRRLVRLSLVLTFLVALILVPMELIFGQATIGLWTSNGVSVSFIDLSVIVLGTAIQAIWWNFSVVLLGLNRQSEYSYFFLVSSGVGIILGYFLAPIAGIAGLGAGLAAGDLIMLLIVGAKIIPLVRK